MLKDFPFQLKSYMLQAFCNASQSTALRRKAGAIVLREISPGYFQPLSSGCNGTRPGKSNWCEDIKGVSYVGEVVHAERNCLKKMQQEGIPSKGCIVVVTLIPCKDCVLDLIDAGITEVYYCEESSSSSIKTEKSIQELAGHNIYIQQIDKSLVADLSLAVNTGLTKNKFMGQDVESDFQNFEKQVKELSTEETQEMLDLFDLTGPRDWSDTLIDFISLKYTKYRNKFSPKDRIQSLCSFFDEQSKLSNNNRE